MLDHRWRELAEQATKETDGNKLVEIVEELCGVLRLREELKRKENIDFRDSRCLPNLDSHDTNGGHY